jgi:chromosome segregation ATPase
MSGDNNAVLMALAEIRRDLAEARGELTEQRAALTRLEANLTDTRVTLMDRMDRLQHRLDQTFDDIAVNYGAADRSESIAKGALEETRSLAAQVTVMTRQIRRLQSDVEALKDKGGGS